ncbi:MAG: MBL fold metallo-hydrolase [Bacteroidota bacterium]
MPVASFTVNPFQENTYVCHSAGEAVIIDPGCSTASERQRVLGYLEEHDLTVVDLLLTHGHIDHVVDCAFFSERFGMPFAMHPEDAPLIADAPGRARMYGFSIDPPPAPGRELLEGDSISFGDTTWEIFHCPGHSPGSVCFYDAAEGYLIAGDVLFSGSVGRTDLWRGSMPQLISSITAKLLPLPDATIVHPGHGPATTIGTERRTNPFL